jgi:nucleoside-diphosphate-sugar epimerase
MEINMNSAWNIMNEDGCNVANCKAIQWDDLQGGSILITGATGLIGMNLIRGIMSYNEGKGGNVKVLALVRNVDKATSLFSEYIEKNWLKLVQGDILKPLVIEENIDYIVHGASVTASRDFVEKPVETITTAIDGTKAVLELAREKKVKAMVYLSSMEVYGTPYDETPLSEDKMGYLNPLAVRSSYSESKQMVENLCVAYQSEYDVPVKIVRLTQTFGPGVAADDGRVFAEFARCAVNGRDIRLQTEGLTKRMYLYTADAVTAILSVLTKGENGQAYNAANMDTYCSIREMADMVAKEFGQGKSKVVLAIPDVPNASYNPVMSVYLDTEKLQALGWQAEVNLTEMYRRMILCMR